MNVEKHAGVWDALGDNNAQAENLRIRSELMMELAGWISRTGLTQAQAARRLGVTQPRISDLVRGRIDLFSIDTLVNMLTAAGLHLELHVREAS
jgi:predicted XRE-type DNA-binding protein